MEPGELTQAGTKAAVGVTGASYSALGLPLSDLVALLTLLFLLLQIVVIAPKVWEVISKFLNKDKDNG